MTATNTPERGLIGTVALVSRATDVTCLRGVTRVNEYNSNATHLSFVADVPAKLKEAPIAVFCTYRFPNRCALANMRQVFQRYCTGAAFGFLYKLLGNDVVGVRLKAALPAAHGFQAPFGAFRTNGLQAIPATLIPLSYTFYLCATVLFAIAIRGKVDNPQINAQRCVNIIRCWFVNVARYKEVELTFTKHKITFALSVLQQLALSFSTHKRDRLPVVIRNRPDRNGLLVKVERQDAIIIGDTAVRSVRALHLPVQLVTVTDFGKATNNHLCRQAVVSLDALVHQLLQIVLPKYLPFPRHVADVVTRGVCRCKRALQSISLFKRRVQLNLGDDFHILNYNTFYVRCKRMVGGRRSSAGTEVPQLPAVFFCEISTPVTDAVAKSSLTGSVLVPVPQPRSRTRGGVEGLHEGRCCLIHCGPTYLNSTTDWS